MASGKVEESVILIEYTRTVYSDLSDVGRQSFHFSSLREHSKQKGKQKEAETNVAEKRTRELVVLISTTTGSHYSRYYVKPPPLDFPSLFKKKFFMDTVKYNITIAEKSVKQNHQMEQGRGQHGVFSEWKISQVLKYPNVQHQKK